MKKVLVFVVLGVLVVTLGIVLMHTVTLKKQITALNGEKQKLTLSLSQREADLVKMNGKMLQLEDEYKKEQKKTDDLVAKNSAINAENSALKEEIDSVKLERDGIQAKLVSIPELKKVIRELKQKQSQVDRIVGKRFRVQKEEKVETAEEGTTTKDLHEIVIGNRGYIIKDGQPTYNTAVRIDVEPAPAR